MSGGSKASAVRICAAELGPLGKGRLCCKVLTCSWHEQPCTVAHHLQASATVLDKLKEREEAKHKAAKLKNELESYIISIRSKVGDSPRRMSLADLLVAQGASL